MRLIAERRDPKGHAVITEPVNAKFWRQRLTNPKRQTPKGNDMTQTTTTGDAAATLNENELFEKFLRWKVGPYGVTPAEMLDGYAWVTGPDIVLSRLIGEHS